MKQAERPQHRKAPHLRTHGGAGTRVAGVPLRTRRLSTDSAKGAPWLCGARPAPGEGGVGGQNLRERGGDKVGHCWPCGGPCATAKVPPLPQSLQSILS